MALLSTATLGQVQHRGPEAPAPPKATITPTGAWKPKSSAYLKASNSKANLQFGNAVALSADGNTLAVSSVQEDSGAKGINGNQNDHSAAGAGAVYVYVRGPRGWEQQAYLKASNTESADGFGYSLSITADGKYAGRRGQRRRQREHGCEWKSSGQLHTRSWRRICFQP